jgi:Flp pilus assembly protein TadD
MYMAMGDNDSAYHCLTTSVQENPNYARALSRLSELEVRMHRYDDAVTHARRAVAEVPDEPVPQTNLGVALGLKGEHKEALRHFRRAYDLQPDSWLRLVNLGLAYINVKQTDSAFLYLRNVITAPPSLHVKPTVYAALTEVAIAQGEFSIAEQALAKFRSSGSDVQRAQRLTEMLREAKAGGK